MLTSSIATSSDRSEYRMHLGRQRHGRRKRAMNLVTCLGLPTFRYLSRSRFHGGRRGLMTVIRPWASPGSSWRRILVRRRRPVPCSKGSARRPRRPITANVTDEPITSRHNPTSFASPPIQKYASRNSLAAGMAHGPPRSVHLNLDRQSTLMARMLKNVVHFLRSDAGPTAVEYAFLLGLIFLACLTAISLVGQRTATNFSGSAQSLDDYQQTGN